MEGLAKAGLKPLRVGSTGNVQKSLLEHSLEYKLGIHPLQSTLVRTLNESEKIFRQEQELKKTLKDLNKKLSETKNPRPSMIEREDNMRRALESICKQHKRLQQKAYAIQQQMIREVVAAADVVSIRFDLSIN